ncbi:uncharacterized protein LOC142615071 [Castanea sativa]|uniref:uncharacterized protein LOC142615071 n=1 Tax=Castanea sativa TaxID=21020 RepID=UPI003F64D2CF
MSVQDSPSEAEIVTPAKKSKRGGNFSVEEDKLLVLAWLNTSVDAVHHGNNNNDNDQNNKAPFYTKIAKYFHDHKKDSTRTVVSLTSRWGVINRETSKFCEVFAKVEAKNPNATAEQMKIDAKDLFKEIYKCNFQFEHCWLLLKNLPKWTLNKPRESLRKELPQTPDSIDQDQAGRDDVLLDDTMDFQRPIVRKAEKPNRKRKDTDKEVAEYLKKKMKFLEESSVQEKEVLRIKTEKFRLEELRENERINIEKERLRIERIKEDERIMMVDTSAMSESQKLFYLELQKEILARRTSSK